MYNWSVDEEKFTTAEDLIHFLKMQSDVLVVKKKERIRSTIVTVKFDSYIHPARKIHLTHYIHDRLDHETNISVREVKTRQFGLIGS